MIPRLPDSPKRVLSDAGTLLIGKYRGDHIADVVEEHYTYVRWLVDTVDMDADDRHTITTLLGQRNRDAG